ncbi:hypothetical protein [Mucilaginibacter ginsenosidivorans]|uniref:Uncharacterized protein n=1 Tax=Mucilaginibacter ginsenosidivorans TaxID=398053 RepID=A0A5B8UVQ5_9SPHI|nr:hypothetical protein [Mucilaginibacter ginsenosidivorans]QEC63033.1 hypothetical protein FRZ54_10725 [Mucilaginibacter ginsenosidivorans]
MENRYIVDKKVNRILLISAIAIIVPLIALLYYKVSHDVGGNDLILRDASQMSFHGMVDSIYYDKENHNTETLILSDGYIYELYPDWSTSVAIGDSLSKNVGSLKVMVYKGNVHVSTLDYRELVKNIK